MSKYLERTNASKPTFGDYVTIEMKCYGVPNEYFIHDVMTHPFTSNSWRNVPIDARDPEEHLHDMSETVISVCTQGFHLSGWHIFNVRLSDVLPMKGDKWAWQESPLRTRIAELEATVEIHADISNAYEKRISEIVSLSNKANAKLQSRIAELENERRWIPVSERLPEEDTDGNTLMVICRHSGEWVRAPFGAEFADEFVRHYSYWMYAPQPPEVQDEH
jgi:hypothetical protein